jgi:hypothetical protein
MKNTNPIVVQRATKKKREQQEREEALLDALISDPRRQDPTTIGRVLPLIEDDNDG